jgi:SAM-dependent methyltransferase
MSSPLPSSSAQERREPQPDALDANVEALLTIDVLRCPVERCRLEWDAASKRLRAVSGECSYPLENNIPCLFAPNQWPADKSDVTELVKAFYEQTPFPNYDGLDSRESLRQKANAGVAARMLDQQLPQRARILEMGCGTGQLSNFLGMRAGRIVVGADVCMNSLKLAKDFRDRYSIANTLFVQMNLFRPPFPEAAFDLVVSNGVLHHTSDCAGAFRAIAPLVKPGGLLMVGLYNWLGRLPTLWARAWIERYAAIGALLDRRLRQGGEAARREAWFMDQYKHPHETRHSIDELLGWFDAAGFEFTQCIPTIGDTEFSEDMPLFEPSSRGNYLDRLSTQLEMLMTGGVDGGLFVVIARRIK